MYFADLETCRYDSGPYDADSWKVPLLAVGWLEYPHPFPREIPPDGRVSQLQGLVFAAKKAHPHHNFRGLHRCSFCEAKHGASEGLENSHVNLFVPGNGVVFLAPAGITHYMESHLYAPPAEFVVAVSQCPTYGSPEFYEALRVTNQHSVPPIRSREEELHASREWQRKLREALRNRDV